MGSRTQPDGIPHFIALRAPHESGFRKQRTLFWVTPKMTRLRLFAHGDSSALSTTMLHLARWGTGWTCFATSGDVGVAPVARTYRIWYVCRMTAMTASEARRNLFGLIEQVNEDCEAVEILSKRGDAVLISASEYRALQETAHLLRVPANAKRLTESLEALAAGRGSERELVWPED